MDVMPTGGDHTEVSLGELSRRLDRIEATSASQTMTLSQNLAAIEHKIDAAGFVRQDVAAVEKKAQDDLIHEVKRKVEAVERDYRTAIAEAEEAFTAQLRGIGRRLSTTQGILIVLIATGVVDIIVRLVGH